MVETFDAAYSSVPDKYTDHLVGVPAAAPKSEGKSKWIIGSCRETDPRKPVSSQGGRRFTGTGTGKHGMNSESSTNVLTRQWRIAESVAKPQIRGTVCPKGARPDLWGALNQPRALPGNR